MSLVINLLLYTDTEQPVIEKLYRARKYYNIQSDIFIFFEKHILLDQFSCF